MPSQSVRASSDRGCSGHVADWLNRCGKQYRGASERSKQGEFKAEASFRDLRNVSDFWTATKDGRLEEGSCVSIAGQLSKYAPFLVGPPKLKRAFHLGYRRKLEHEKLAKREKAKIHPMLSFTAGQMVWRLNIEKKDTMWLGLYHSIVRNSIPIFVEGEYYRKHVRKIFGKSSNHYVIEAKITGQVMEFKNELMEEIVNSDQLKGHIRPDLLKEGRKPVFGIKVDGKNTRIEYVDEARYLDGDIWVALEDKGTQFFVSRFIDLADKKDLEEGRANLEQDVNNVKKSRPAARIVFQFDQVSKLFPLHEDSSVEERLEEIFASYH